MRQLFDFHSIKQGKHGQALHEPAGIQTRVLNAPSLNAHGHMLVFAGICIKSYFFADSSLLYKHS